MIWRGTYSSASEVSELGGAMVAVWSDKGNSSRERMGSDAGPRVAGTQGRSRLPARQEQDVAPRPAAPRARGPAPARRTRRGRPTRCARPRARRRRTSRRSSRGVKQVVHRSTSASRPSSSLMVVRSWATPAAASKVVCLRQVAHLEVGGEGGERDRAAGRTARAMPSSTTASGSRRRLGSPPPAASPKAPWQREIDRVELAVEGQGPGVEPLEGHPVGRVPPGQVDEALRDVDAVDRRCRAGRARARGGPARSPRRAPACPARGRARRPGSRPPARSPS